MREDDFGVLDNRETLQLGANQKLVYIFKLCLSIDAINKTVALIHLFKRFNNARLTKSLFIGHDSICGIIHNLLQHVI